MRWRVLPWVLAVVLVVGWAFIVADQRRRCERAGGEAKPSMTSRTGMDCVVRDGVVIRP